MNLNKCVLLFMAIITLHVSAGERLHEQIYSSIEGGAACFRRLNGTHQAGCSSSLNGAVGVVHMLKTIVDAEWLVMNSTAPHIAVVSISLFPDVVELLLANPQNIVGLLLFENVTESVHSFTQESRCPNEYASANGSKCSSEVAGGLVWNERGSGLLRRDIPFPIFYLPGSRAEEIEKVNKCYERYNLDKENQHGNPLCSIQLNSFMYAAVSSEVCLRRSATTTFLTPTKVCDPLGDHNVYYSLFPRGEETETSKKPVTLVTARIDSASLFDGISPGAAGSVVGLVTFITAASLLSKMIPLADASLHKHNIMWTLFNGESFDYIGSQRVAYDLSRGTWPPNSPLEVSQIKLHVEVGQLGGSLLPLKENVSWPLYAFAYSSGTLPGAPIIEFIEELSQNLKKNNLSVETEFTTNLPPSSLHSFRRILKNVTESGDLPELLVTDHQQAFTNMFYHSVLDDYDNVAFVYHNISIDTNGTFLDTDALLTNGTMKETDMQVKIAYLATAFTYTLYQRVVGAPYTGNMKASAHLVDEMLYCFLKSQSCRLLAAADFATASDDVPTKPAPLYVSVSAWPGAPAAFAGHLLALLAGERLTLNRTGCDAAKDNNFSYYWLRGWNHTGICMQTTMNFTQAVSPAFIIQDYSFASGEFSSWTESVWQSMSARVFVASSGVGARTAALAGAAATLLAAVITHCLRQNSQRIFNMPLPATTDNAAATGILRSVNC